MSCCGRPARQQDGTPAPPPPPGQIASAETFIASAQSRYVVVARRQATEGKRFSTLTAAQDYARRSGGIIRQL
jgi:hypothetical protein